MDVQSFCNVKQKESDIVINISSSLPSIRHLQTKKIITILCLSIFQTDSRFRGLLIAESGKCYTALFLA